MAPVRSWRAAVWPILIGLAACLPGGVTFDFALNEAREMGNDWVKISMPLLAFGGLCISYGLYRLFGKVGLGVGVLAALAGLVGAYLALDGKVSERQEYDRNRYALEATAELCNGKTAADDRALPYDAAAKGPRPTSVYTSNGGDYWSSSYDDAYDAWRPELPQIQQSQLLACVRELKQPPIEKCLYTGGASLERVRYDKQVQLFAIATGALVFETTVVGATPRECKGLEEFYGDYKDSIIPGEAPSHSAVVEALRPHVD